MGKKIPVEPQLSSSERRQIRQLFRAIKVNANGIEVPHLKVNGVIDTEELNARDALSQGTHFVVTEKGANVKKALNIIGTSIHFLHAEHQPIMAGISVGTDDVTFYMKRNNGPQATIITHSFANGAYSSDLFVSREGVADICKAMCPEKPANMRGPLGAKSEKRSRPDK